MIDDQSFNELNSQRFRSARHSFDLYEPAEASQTSLNFHVWEKYKYTYFKPIGMIY